MTIRGGRAPFDTPARARSVRERYGNSWLDLAPLGSKCPGQGSCDYDLAAQEPAKSTFAS